VTSESPPTEAAVEEAVPGQPGSLWRNWNFQAMWTSESLAGIAKESAEVAYPLLILARTGSAFEAGAVGSAWLFTASFMSIPGGILADRMSRRLLLMLCDVIRAGLLGLFALLIVTNHFDIGVIFAISIASAACLGISQPTGLAVVKQIVRPDQIKEATAQNQVRFFGATMIGPPIGGSLFGVAQALPFFTAALSFLAGGVVTQLIRTPMKVVTGAKGFSKANIAEGFRIIWRQPILRLLMLWAMGSNMAFTHSSVFLAIIATAKSRGAPPSIIGLTLAVAGAGGIVGAVVATWVIKRVKPGVIFICAAWAGPVAAVGLALVPGAVPLGVIVAFVFIRAPIVNALLLAYIAKLVSNELQGRVLGAVMFISMIAMPIGVFLVGLVFDLGGPRWVFTTIGVLAAIAALPTLSRTVRHLPQPEDLTEDLSVVRPGT
jgi:predicted MFS family arabinose efflux permease